MTDRRIGELPALTAMTADTKIPVEHDSEAKSMAGRVLQDYVRDTVDAEVPIIARIVAVGPKGDNGVSPTLTASKTGKITTIYYTDADHQSGTDVLAELRDGADGSGVGDMLKATYDADDDGIVDDSAKLGGQPPEFYQALVLEENDPNAYDKLLAKWPTTGPVIVHTSSGYIPVSVYYRDNEEFLLSGEEIVGDAISGYYQQITLFRIPFDQTMGWSMAPFELQIASAPQAYDNRLITSGAVYEAIGSIESALEALL